MSYRKHIGWKICVLALGIAGSMGPRAAEGVDRLVEFRDGTLLQMSLPDEEVPWQRVAPNGSLLPEPIALADVAHIELVETTVIDRLEQVRQAAIDLGDNDYHVRESSQNLLIQLGSLFRPVLEEAKRENRDPDYSRRIGEVLKQIGNSARPDLHYDGYSVSAEGELIRGDVGDWTINGETRSCSLSLTRESVRRISPAQSAANQRSASMLGGWQRIVEDEDENFPNDIQRISFETNPIGTPLVTGEDISDVFISEGIILEPSIEGSIISVQRYNVRGRSGGMCAATHDPIYEGMITIRFCEPGNRQVAAGVHYIGFWTAHIVPEGTTLEAYDLTGRPITSIKTQRNTRDFLCIRSAVPIAEVRIVPDLEIDPNFAIDDLTFDRPVALSAGTSDSQYSFLLTSGERFKVGGMELDEGHLVVRDMTIGIEEMTFDRDEVASFYPPYAGPGEQTSEAEECFVLLKDGSIVRAQVTEEGLVAHRTGAEQPLEKEDIAALWGHQTFFEEPAEDQWPNRGGMLLGASGEDLNFREWSIGAEWIESDALSELSGTYATSPVIWFKRLDPPDESSGQVRLNNGESLVIADSAYELIDWSISEVQLRYQGEEVIIPMAMVISLTLPASN